MAEIRTKCVNSERCTSCTVSTLPDPSDRVWAGNIVFSAVKTLKEGDMDPSDISMDTIRQTVTHYAESFGYPQLASTAMGSVAITLANECNIE